jgi:hypothetical protein
MDKLPKGLGHYNVSWGHPYDEGDKHNHYFKALESKIDDLVTKVNEIEGEPEVRYERWLSNDNEEEIHYFLGNTYLFGYNPEFVSEEEVQQQLRRINDRRSSVS